MMTYGVSSQDWLIVYMMMIKILKIKVIVLMFTMNVKNDNYTNFFMCLEYTRSII